MTRRTGGYAAAVADVEVNKSTGKVTVQRVTLAHDCGLIVNPDGVKNQVEGNIVQGVSRALFEEVVFDASGVTSLDWNSYPILKFPDVPDLDIVLDQSTRRGFVGRRRAGDRSSSRGHRQRNFRCDRDSPTRSAFYLEANFGGTPGGNADEQG